MKKKAGTPTDQIILEVAENLFLEKGFAGTSTTEIARVAGCNQALVHYYFRTKERLFHAVFEKTACMILAALFEDPGTEMSLEEEVRRRADRLYDILKENPRTAHFFFSELNANPERLRGLAGRSGIATGKLLMKLEEQLAPEIEKGAIRPVTATDLFLNLLSIVMVPFLAAPVLKELAGMTEQDYSLLIDARKRENITVLLKSLRP
jgi:AcrR family transcriptional regulator